jgi:hypothetical protein
MRPLLRFAVVLSALIVIAMLGGIGLQLAGHLATVEAFMRVARPWLIGAQFAVTAWLWLRWHVFVRWLARTGRIPELAVQPLTQARHRIVAFVLLIQLTVVLGLPFSVMDKPGQQ